MIGCRWQVRRCVAATTTSVGARALLPVAAMLATTLAGCGTADLAAQRASEPHPNATASPGQAQQPAAATIADLLVTYAAGNPCADVQVETPIAQVPAACAALWSPLRVTVVPGQNLLPRTPRFPSVFAGSGVTSDEAIRYAAGMWRTEAFHGFALGTAQLGIADALGREHLFVRVGADEQAVAQGDTVTTPLCHFFPAAMRVVVLTSDFTAYEQRRGRSLGVVAHFVGPCYATATDAKGVSHKLFEFTGTRDAIFVGDLVTDPRFGSFLLVSGLEGCDAPVAHRSCA